MKTKQKQNKPKDFYRSEILNGNIKALDFLINDYIESNLALEEFGGDDDSALEELEGLAEELLGYKRNKTYTKQAVRKWDTKKEVLARDLKVGDQALFNGIPEEIIEINPYGNSSHSLLFTTNKTDSRNGQPWQVVKLAKIKTVTENQTK